MSGNISQDFTRARRTSSKLKLGTAAASTGTRKGYDSEDQSISIYKKHCLGHATQKDGKNARSKKSLLEPGTSQAPSIRQQESVMDWSAFSFLSPAINLFQSSLVISLSCTTRSLRKLIVGFYRSESCWSGSWNSRSRSK